MENIQVLLKPNFKNPEIIIRRASQAVQRSRRWNSPAGVKKSSILGLGYWADLGVPNWGYYGL